MANRAYKIIGGKAVLWGTGGVAAPSLATVGIITGWTPAQAATKADVQDENGAVRGHVVYDAAWTGTLEMVALKGGTAPAAGDVVSVDDKQWLVATVTRTASNADTEKLSLALERAPGVNYATVTDEGTVALASAPAQIPQGMDGGGGTEGLA